MRSGDLLVEATGIAMPVPSAPIATVDHGRPFDEPNNFINGKKLPKKKNKK